MTRLDIGSGQHPKWSNPYWIEKLKLSGQKEDWITIDINPDHKPDYVLDLEDNKLPADDNSVDEIFCWHCLEHLQPVAVASLVSEMYRVLKKGGKAHIGVPNVLWAMFHPEAGLVSRYSINGTGGFGEWHYFYFTPASLAEIFFNVGFHIESLNYHDVLIPDYPENSLELWVIKYEKKV